MDNNDNEQIFVASSTTKKSNAAAWACFFLGLFFWPLLIVSIILFVKNKEVNNVYVQNNFYTKNQDQNNQSKDEINNSNLEK